MIRKQNMLGMGIAAVLATTALAQGSNPQDEPSIKAAVEDIKWSIQEDFGYYTFDGGEDLLAFDTTFAPATSPLGHTPPSLVDGDCIARAVASGG